MTKTSHDSETPAHGQQVISACAFIHHDFDGVTKVFLPKRADTKKFLPGLHEIPGGHIDFGESIIDGLKREIREEFEIDVIIGDPFAAFDYTNEIRGSHSVEIVYFATLLGSPSDIKLHPADHSSYQWVTEEQTHEIMATERYSDDPELQNVSKGFALLKGASLNFGK